MVTNSSGSSAPARVTVTPTADALAASSARYTPRKCEWRVDGTSSAGAGQTATAHLGGLGGPTIGTAVVDALDAFRLMVTGGLSLSA